MDGGSRASADGFSKTVEGHAAMVALCTMSCNFCRVHETLRVTPAMQAGLTDHVWDMEEVVACMDERAPRPAHPKPHKKRQAEDLKPRHCRVARRLSNAGGGR